MVSDLAVTMLIERLEIELGKPGPGENEVGKGLCFLVSLFWSHTACVDFVVKCPVFTCTQAFPGYLL